MTRSATMHQKPARSRSPRIIEWDFQAGPPHRSAYWYASVVVVGLVISGLLLLLTTTNVVTTVLTNLIWVGVILGIALAPRMDYIGQLDGDLLAIYTVKGHRVRLERNLRDFASWRVEVIQGDRLNPDRQWLVLQRRDGRGAIEIKLPSNAEVVTQILERVNGVVPLAPQVAPSPIDTFFTFAQRWMGWWR